MKARNLHIFGDSNKLSRLAEEYALLGRKTRTEEGKLTVFCLPRKKRKKK
jgi:hypothetical protein